MKSLGLLRQFESELKQAQISQPSQLIRQLMAHRLKVSQASLLANPDREIPLEIQKKLQEDVAALVQGVPSAYVFGEIPFLEWDFAIDPRALIPRPETEALAQLIRKSHRKPPKIILDLCCGSGILGLSLALSFPKSKVILTDLCFEALALCQENVNRLGLDDRAWCVAGDLWDAVPPGQRFDLIVANPPYVANTDPVEKSVTGYEPHLALFSPDNGMAHLKTLLSGLDEHLEPGGFAAFECGHNHSKTLLQSMDSSHFGGQFTWRKDPFGVARYLFYDGAI